MLIISKLTTRRIFIASISVLVFGASLLAYAVSYASIDITPNEEQILASNKPVISVDWPYAIGANLKDAKVYLDGKDISSQIKVHSKGFTYRTPKNLPQGIHVIRAKLKYNFLVTKKVDLKWFFSTDTVPPKIVMNERNNTLASRTPNLGLKAKTEPFTRIEAVFNNQKKFIVDSNKKGDLVIDLKGLKKNNSLLIKARDRAGNITNRKLSVLIDTGLPVIKSVGTGVIFTNNHKNKLRAVVEDKESGIIKAVMRLNGQVVKTKYDHKSGTVVPFSTPQKDGRYRGELRVVDVAGNEVVKKWTFVVDTSRIVVDQSDFKLNLYHNNKVIHTLNVAVGRPGFPTPNGNWEVERKSAAPSWHNPHQGWSSGMPEVIGPGPSNPLGLRAIYLNAPGIRIHGTSAYYSIGSRASHGCIRVRNMDIVGFFPKVRVGTPVLIRP